MLTIRRKLFWAFDVILLLFAFGATGWVAPFVRNQLTLGNGLYAPWVEFLAPAPPDGNFPPMTEYLWAFMIMAPTMVLCIDLIGGHRPIKQQRLLRILTFSFVGPLAGVSLLSTMFVLLRDSAVSRIIIFSFAASSSVVIMLSRLLARGWYIYMLRTGVYTQEIAIIGSAQKAALVGQRLKADAPPEEFRLIGYFDITQREPDDNDLPFLGNVATLGEVLVHQAIQRIIVVLPEAGGTWVDNTIQACDYFRVAVDIVPETLLSATLNDLVPETDGRPTRLPALKLSPIEVQATWLVIKRVVDVCISALLLLLLSPLFLVIAISIKLTTPRLPVFFPWRVVGYRGRRFTGYKFTTMIEGAEKKLGELANLNEMTGPVFKIVNDPRVTPLGRFLRKFSLNELPQLWSVLKGDMSLVGPRPAGPHELVRYELWHKRKLSAQPGITCFWQIRGRNRISNFDDWVKMDLEYIRNRSLWLDFKILARTAWVVVRGTGS